MPDRATTAPVERLPVARWTALVVLLFGELVLLMLRFDTDTLRRAGKGWWAGASRCRCGRRRARFAARSTSRGSSVLFGAMHSRLLAGTLAGMLYALALRRRGEIADPIIAHATTNALIAAWVLATAQWSLWA